MEKKLKLENDLFEAAHALCKAWFPESRSLAARYAVRMYEGYRHSYNIDMAFRAVNLSYGSIIDAIATTHPITPHLTRCCKFITAARALHDSGY